MYEPVRQPIHHSNDTGEDDSESELMTRCNGSNDDLLVGANKSPQHNNGGNAF